MQAVSSDERDQLTLVKPAITAETRDRTGDLQIFSLTLSQLSYRGSCCSVQMAIQHICKKNMKAEAQETKRQRGDSNPCGQSPMDF